MSAAYQRAALEYLLSGLSDEAVAARLELAVEEIRVARLIAHMRPYLLSRKRPMRARIPAPRAPKEVSSAARPGPR